MSVVTKNPFALLDGLPFFPPFTWTDLIEFPQRTARRLPPLHQILLQVHKHRPSPPEEVLNEVLVVLVVALLLEEENTTPGAAQRPPDLVRELAMKKPSGQKRRNVRSWLEAQGWH
jgi:hypothetical protein